MTAEQTSQSREKSLDNALAESFPASDPVSVANPSIGTVADQPRDQGIDDEELARRIGERAEKLWLEAGKPATGAEAFTDDARTLIAIEDNPKAGTLPNPMTRPDRIGPEGEPIEPAAETANEGEFPTLTDQGDQVYPPRRPPPR